VTRAVADSALLTLWHERGVDPALLRTRADGSIAAAEQLLGTSETLAADESAQAATDLELSTERLGFGALLGRGGMGEVFVAEQASLRREVAVKTALDASSTKARAALLKEAWVGAALEHPNVVPIHTLARTDRGLTVVMKRIEGTSWADVMAGSGPDRFRGPLGFEAHVRVFLDVCRAVAFAHRRGVLHLDLKPENVMIGDFGEVYVVDWGLACGTPEGPTWLARASDLRGPAGTPAYMAPELAGADAAQIGPRTDVYLLGAILHEVVTGDAPHDGATLVEILTRAFESAPSEYGEGVPRELAAILHRARSRETEQRFESVDALRESVEEFLRHRGAEHFADRAGEALADADARLASRSDAGNELEACLAECEAAIELARREWPAHPRLVALAQGLLERRALHAVLEERLEAAEAFSAKLSAPSPALTERLTALRVALDARGAHVRSLETLGRELDLTLGSRERRAVFATLAACWAIQNILFGWLDRTGTLLLDYRLLLLYAGLLVATLVPYGWWRRHTLFQNRANRRLYGGFIFTAVAVELFWIAGLLLHVPTRTALAITPFFYTYAFATLGFVVDRRFLRGASVLLLAAALAARLPAWGTDIVGVAGAVAVWLTLGRAKSQAATAA
jgi:serine/threonine-protein kinase